jgi:hypothetical protein
MAESEFGTVIGDIHGGDIIKTDNGEMVYVSEAFNPLNETQLLEILDLIRESTI